MSRTITDLDIWRAAALIVKHYGDDATTHAAMRADALPAAGDLDGQRVWLRILSIIEEQRRERTAREPLH